jgi:Cu2+-exporting ATPase
VATAVEVAPQATGQSIDELSNPYGIATVFDLSRAAGRRVKGNIGWALCYNAIAIPLAVTGLLNPLFAAVAMGLSSLLVVTNSSRPLLAE